MEYVKQTGLIVKPPSLTDHIADRVTGIEEILNPSGDWGSYITLNESQFGGTFDTLSCTTFSAVHVVEILINYYLAQKKFSVAQMQTMNDLGFLTAEGKFRASKRFTAIMSGTTKLGNDFVSVWNSIRHDGLLPEKDFPFGGATWEGYHNISLITSEMVNKAKKILEIIDVAYAWVFFDYAQDPRFSDFEVAGIETQIKQSPLHMAVPIPAFHAVAMLKWLPDHTFETYDHYPPYEIYTWTQVHYAMKGIVTIKKPIMNYHFAIDLFFGMTHPSVKDLQIVLNSDPDTRIASSGVGSPGNETNYFGSLTKNAVMRFQKKHGIIQVGRVGVNTRAKLNALFGGEVSTPAPTPTTPSKGKIDAWCEAIKKHEGWYPGSRSYRNNNPGNIRYVGQKRATGRDSGGFCIFPNYAAGYAELREMLVRCCTGKSNIYKPEMSLRDFFHKYAPTADHNNPDAYARAVAAALGVDVNIKIKELL